MKPYPYRFYVRMESFKTYFYELFCCWYFAFKRKQTLLELMLKIFSWENRDGKIEKYFLPEFLLGFPRFSSGWWREQIIGLNINFKWWREQIICWNINFKLWWEQIISWNINFKWWVEINISWNIYSKWWREMKYPFKVVMRVYYRLKHLF